MQDQRSNADSIHLKSDKKEEGKQSGCHICLEELKKVKKEYIEVKEKFEDVANAKKEVEDKLEKMSGGGIKLVFNVDLLPSLKEGDS